MTAKKPLTVWMIALINVAAICNIKNFPVLSEYGLATLFFLLISALIFFIPLSLVSAELSTGWPERGVYTWVREAFGPRIGFLAIWLQWIENVIWYPTILSFIAATFAYVIDPTLALQPLYTIAVILITFWGTTCVNYFGMRISGWISSIGAFCTIVPMVLIILLSLLWIGQGNPIQIEFSWRDTLPSFTHLNDYVLLIGFLFGFAGMEMSSVHAKDVLNPKRNYPLAVLFSAILIFGLYAAGAVAIAAIVPQKDIQLASGGMDAFAQLFSAFGIPWATHLTAAVTVLGALGMMSSWIVGPSRGLLATAQHDGDLPPALQKTNRHHMPVGIFLLQGIIVTLLSLVFLFMPSVNSSYWILLSLAAQLYLLMYILLFLAAIRLRYSKPLVHRAYRVPGGNWGICLASGLGIASCALAVIISFLPPSQIDTGSHIVYQSILTGGVIFFCVIPFLIYAAKKPSWKSSRYD